MDIYQKDNDQPNRADPRNHWCEAKGCDVWGGWGFKVNKVTRWLCKAHADAYKAKQAKAAAAAKVAIPPPVKQTTQGSLF